MKRFRKVVSFIVALALIISMLSATEITAFAKGKGNGNSKAYAKSAAFAVDERIPVSAVEISGFTRPVFGNPVEFPELYSADGVVRFNGVIGDWYKQNSRGQWTIISRNATFGEGNYRFAAQIRIDNNDEYYLTNGCTVTVDGDEWTELTHVYDGASYCYDFSYSPIYTVELPLIPPLTFTDDDDFDIPDSYVGEEIAPIDLSGAVSGGTEPYIFTKVSGPSWINVSSDGNVSGTPAEESFPDNLVVRVTDARGAYKQITIDVSWVNPAPEEPEDPFDPDDGQETTELHYVDFNGFNRPVYEQYAFYTDIFSLTTNCILSEEESTWQIETMSGVWEDIPEGYCFGEGRYRYQTQIRTESSDVILADDCGVYVDGEEWQIETPCETTDNYAYANITSPIYEIGHDYEEFFTPATLEENGLEGEICTRCGHREGRVIYSPASFTLSESAYIYDGRQKTPSLTILDRAGNFLAENTDYVVNADSGRINAGTYYYRVTFIGDYSGTYQVSFVINPAQIGSASLSEKNYTYDGTVKTPTVTVKDQNGNVISSSNYTVVYQSGRKVPGTYTVTVTMRGNYTGTVTLAFNIGGATKEITKLTALSRGFTVYWQSGSNLTGYQIEYSTNASFNSVTRVNVTNYTVGYKTITGLRAKTKYFVRIRTYKQTTIGTNLYTAYSAYSAVKNVTTK